MACDGARLPTLPTDPAPYSHASCSHASTHAGLAATANWVSNAAVAQTFLTLTHSLGGSGAFYLYAAMACAGFLWAFAALPETSGLTLDQVQELFGGEDGTGDSGGGGGGGSSGGMLWSGHRKKRSSDGKAEVLGGT